MWSAVGQILSMVTLDFLASPVNARDLMLASHCGIFCSILFCSVLSVVLPNRGFPPFILFLWALLHVLSSFNPSLPVLYHPLNDKPSLKTQYLP